MTVEAVFHEAPDRPARQQPGAQSIPRYVLGLVALPAIYYAAAKVGYLLEFAGPVAAIVWLPVGVGISFLYLGGLRLWPGVVLGDLLANDYGALPLGSALGQTAGNLLEVLVATILIRRLVGSASPLASLRGLWRMMVALAVGTAVSATVGGISLALGDIVDAGNFASIWRTWWLGDLSGALVVVPLAIAWAHPEERGARRGSVLEAALVLAAIAGFTELSFRGDVPVTYLVFAALMWAALRFGARGATVGVAVAASLTIWDTTHYDGPFVFHSITRSVLSTQLYIGVSALTALSLAAVVAERERIARHLAASRARLVEASDAARRRLEHDLHDGAQQRLTALAVSLGCSAAETEQRPDRAPELFAAASADLDVAIEELRQLARGLHPGVLTQLGLASAVRDVASRSLVPVTVVEAPSHRLGTAAEATAYFVFAEAVTNAQRHANASAIRVGIFVALQALNIIVSDDGDGGAAEHRGSGLEGLRDRVEATGGTFEVDSPPGQGTRIRAAIPLTGATT
jgi:signal transduction histidine kinase